MNICPFVDYTCIKGRAFQYLYGTEATLLLFYEAVRLCRLNYLPFSYEL